jgi:hypothetical protein
MTLTRWLPLVPILACVACGKQADPGFPDIRPALVETDLGDVKTIPTLAPTAVSTTFAYAEDDAGKLLAKMLAPPAVAPLAPPSPAGRLERPLPGWLEFPECPTTQRSLGPVRCPARNDHGVRPAAPIERAPLQLAQAALEPPDRPELPVGALVSRPAPDVKLPPSLPILARPSSDRASLEDPTTEFTAASIIRATLPLRSQQAPFVKVNLPDPFENAEAVKVKITVTEDPQKALGSPPPPKP